MESLTAHEKAIATYKALQKRKKKRLKLKESESAGYADEHYNRRYRRTKSSNGNRVNRYNF